MEATWAGLITPPLTTSEGNLASTAPFFAIAASHPKSAAMRNVQVAAGLSAQPSMGTPDCVATAHTASPTPSNTRSETCRAAVQLPSGKQAQVAAGLSAQPSMGTPDCVEAWRYPDIGDVNAQRSCHLPLEGV